ncbi:hypothetical protein CHEID_01610 [Corynebacterium heidelbergense]|nr:hypothetical protein CHEID_01610 [Corynebacterium heidelbergense]
MRQSNWKGQMAAVIVLILSITPVLQRAASCIYRHDILWQLSCAYTALILVFVGLILSLLKIETDNPKSVIKEGFPFLLTSYVPAVLSNWIGPLSIFRFIYPLIVYWVLVANPRIRSWMQTLARE